MYVDLLCHCTIESRPQESMSILIRYDLVTRKERTMLYAIISEDVTNSGPLRSKGRAGHIARLEALREQGRLILAGPHPAIDSPDPGPAGYSGSLVVADFKDLQSAQAWADSDPYVATGAYARVRVKPFKLVLP